MMKSYYKVYHYMHTDTHIKHPVKTSVSCRLFVQLTVNI